MRSKASLQRSRPSPVVAPQLGHDAGEGSGPFLSWILTYSDSTTSQDGYRGGTQTTRFDSWLFLFSFLLFVDSLFLFVFVVARTPRRTCKFRTRAAQSTLPGGTWNPHCSGSSTQSLKPSRNWEPFQDSLLQPIKTVHHLHAELLTHDLHIASLPVSFWTQHDGLAGNARAQAELE